MARAATRNVDLATYGAWHTAIFALGMYSGKLKGKRLSDFLSSSDSKPSHRSEDVKAIHFFMSLKARGVPIKAEKVTRH